jgi:hypothetical protein
MGTWEAHSILATVETTSSHQALSSPSWISPPSSKLPRVKACWDSKTEAVDKGNSGGMVCRGIGLRGDWYPGNWKAQNASVRILKRVPKVRILTYSHKLIPSPCKDPTSIHTVYLTAQESRTRCTGFKDQEMHLSAGSSLNYMNIIDLLPHIYEIAEKSLQIFFEGNNMMMNAVITFWESVTKCQTITFFTTHSNDKLSWC